MTPAERLFDRRPVTRADQRREDLLAALEKQLRTRSLSEVSVAELTEAAGLTRSAFYFYFDSKATAVMALLAAVDDEAILSGHVLLAGSGTFRDRMVQILGRLVDRVTERPHVYRAMLEARAGNDAIRRLWDDEHDRVTEPIIELIRAERAAGRAPQGSDPRVLADMLVRLNEALLGRLTAEPGLDRRQQIDTVADLWLRAIYGHLAPELDPPGTIPAPHHSAGETA